MNCVVFVKQVIDPELRLSSFRLAPDGRKIHFGDASLVASPYDENALEMALQIKEVTGGKVAVVTLGTANAEKVLRGALALKVDEVVLVEQGGNDPFNHFQTVHMLKFALNHLSFKAELILCGGQAADTNAGLVGPLVAEQLGWPCVGMVREIRIKNNTLVIEREEEDYLYTVELELPAVVTVTSTPFNQIRYPKLKDVIAAQKKPLTKLNNLFSGEALPAELAKWTEKIKLSHFEPIGVRRECYLVKASEFEEMVAEAINWLSEKGVL